MDRWGLCWPFSENVFYRSYEIYPAFSIDFIEEEFHQPELFLFVCLFIAAWAIFQLSDACHHYRWQGCKIRPMLGAQGLWAGRDLYRATPTVTRDLGLHGFIRKTGTHVSQWNSNPRLKDHQILEPNALTTAPRGRFTRVITVHENCKEEKLLQTGQCHKKSEK
jgi:hypothetical protein